VVQHDGQVRHGLLQARQQGQLRRRRQQVQHQTSPRELAHVAERCRVEQPVGLAEGRHGAQVAELRRTSHEGVQSPRQAGVGQVRPADHRRDERLRLR
jgi:hypothetical protein